ncbi:hypothetical protein F3H66_22255 [Serratia marcescens]|uniref:hypothetical protein n=1 Tax=Serratia marcescens TaxID=615 RepID=UPI00187FF4AD|nr:hypothetical protein [Serratia marcescens]MBE8816264.1 hypothetical protein [Serratia marcescens]
MDKFSELKRRADKCPIKRFKAFIGKANTQATLCADTGIEIIGWSGFDASDLNAKSHRVELARFIAAADPETILALLADNEHLARELVARNGEIEWLRKRATDLEAKDAPKDIRIAEVEKRLKQRAEEAESRIAELESIREDASQVFKEIGNELGCNSDNESIMMAIDALKERLATPVRLPTKYSMLHREDFHDDYQSKMVFKADEVIAALRAAGFTVEGDE